MSAIATGSTTLFSQSLRKSCSQQHWELSAQFKATPRDKIRYTEYILPPQHYYPHTLSLTKQNLIFRGWISVQTLLLLDTFLT